MQHPNTVLLAEDDADVRLALKSEFEQNGFKVLEADSIGDALALLREHVIDAIILDMKMPEDTGASDEAAGIRVLRAASHFGLAKTTMPILVFTGYESFPNCVSAIRAGAWDYIPKGILGVNTLREIVRLCRRAIEECRSPPEPVDEGWLVRNYESLSRQFGGKRIAVLPLTKAHDAGVVESVQMDGCKVIATETFEELCERLMRNPAVRDSRPFMALVPCPEEGGR
jgi:DNA-binding NtrC family response regulator